MPKIAFTLYVLYTKFSMNSIIHMMLNIYTCICFICLSQERATISLYIINRLYAEFILC
jgi:hypothetical protein